MVVPPSPWRSGNDRKTLTRPAPFAPRGAGWVTHRRSTRLPTEGDNGKSYLPRSSIAVSDRPAPTDTERRERSYEDHDHHHRHACPRWGGSQRAGDREGCRVAR